MIQVAFIVAACLLSPGSNAQADSSIIKPDSIIRIIPKGVDLLPNKTSVYPLLYQTQSESRLVSSIGYLKGSYLQTTPSNSPLSGITGRLAGLYVTQNSGVPGADIPSLSLRGLGPLIIIDGVPRSATAFNPEQIESVVVLKDALSTAMLGMRGMGGAILINTKNGRSAKESFSVNFKAQAGIQSPTRIRKYLSAYDYSVLFNEALKNDGKPELYTQADLDAYKNGTDPYGHPDVDWTKNDPERCGCF